MCLFDIFTFSLLFTGWGLIQSYILVSVGRLELNIINVNVLFVSKGDVIKTLRLGSVG